MNQLQMVGPFAGIVDAVPAPQKPPNAFDDILNFFCIHGRLQSRPRMGNFDAPADGAAIVSAVTFRDINGFYHSLILTTVSAYYLDDDGSPPLTDPTATTVHTGLPYALALINERVYFSNGSKKIWYADGSQ